MIVVITTDAQPVPEVMARAQIIIEAAPGQPARVVKCLYNAPEVGTLGVIQINGLSIQAGGPFVMRMAVSETPCDVFADFLDGLDLNT